MAFIDRRKNDKNKSLPNRRRFLKRAKAGIKESLKKSLIKRKVTDINSQEGVVIDAKSIKEPKLAHKNIGSREFILPGNVDGIKGDLIPKPSKDDGKGDGGSDDDETFEDEFRFTLSRDEFLEAVFEGLELPNLIKTQLKDLDEYKLERAGFSTTGSINNLSIIRSMRNAIGRTIALKADYDKKITVLEEKLNTLFQIENKTEQEVKRNMWVEEIENLIKRRDSIPFIDDFDLKYKSFEKKPTPSTKAVMFCIMDVSASMGQFEKDIAKRFFMLLYIFLTKKYEKVEIRFIKHHTKAAETDQEDFFYGTETGGTIVSSALALVSDIIKKEYPTSDWNIYISQVSDGDNFINTTEEEEVTHYLVNDLLPFTQYYVYIQIDNPDESYYRKKSLWHDYEQINNDHDNFCMKIVKKIEDIFPVFSEIFEAKHDRIMG